MSNKITAMCRPLRMSPAQKSVLMCIADFAHDDGADWHSQAAIAEWTCLSKRAVIDAVAWLEEQGFLKIDRRIGAKSSTVLLLDRIQAAGAAQAGGNQCASRTSADAAPVQMPHQCAARTGADVAGDQCSSRTTTSAAAAQTGAAAAPEALEASEKHQKQDTPGARRPRPRGHEHPLFAEFYDAYPRKESRADAAKAFAKLDPDRELLTVMLQAIKAQGLARKVARGEGQYVPHPATWVNKARWNDELQRSAPHHVGRRIHLGDHTTTNYDQELEDANP